MRVCSDDYGCTGTSLLNGQCECLLNYYWDPESLECRPHCFTALSKGVHTEDAQKCECYSPAVWNEHIKDCYLECPEIKHSTGQHESEKVCECQSPSNWNS